MSFPDLDLMAKDEVAEIADEDGRGKWIITRAGTGRQPVKRQQSGDGRIRYGITPRMHAGSRRDGQLGRPTR
jgi:hypothetical protein